MDVLSTQDHPKERTARSSSRKLPASFNPVAVPLVLSVFMSCLVSGISTVASLGFSGEWLRAWMAAWGVSWLIAFPTLILVLPLVRRIVAAIVEPAQPTPGGER